MRQNLRDHNLNIKTENKDNVFLHFYYKVFVFGIDSEELFLLVY